MVSFDPPWPRNTDWSNMGASPGECSIEDGGTATRIDEDDGGLLTVSSLGRELWTFACVCEIVTLNLLFI